MSLNCPAVGNALSATVTLVMQCPIQVIRGHAVVQLSQMDKSRAANASREPKQEFYI